VTGIVDALAHNPGGSPYCGQLLYGYAGVSAGGNAPPLTPAMSTSYPVDYDGDTTTYGTTFPGSIEACEDPCFDWNVRPPILLKPGGIVQVIVTSDPGGGKKLYVGVTFSSVNGVAANNISCFDGATGSPLGAGTDGPVKALCVLDDPTGPALYAGGTFTTAGGVASPYIAKWKAGAWSPLGGKLVGLASEIDPTGVNFLLAHDDGSGEALFIGGRFDGFLDPTQPAGALTSPNIIKWTGFGCQSAGLGPHAAQFGSPKNGYVSTMTVYDDGLGPALHVGGEFDSSAGGPIPVGLPNDVTQWDGSAWSVLGGVGTYGRILAFAGLEIQGQNRLFAGSDWSFGPGVGGLLWYEPTIGWIAPPLFFGALTALEVFGDGSGPALHISDAGFGSGSGTVMSLSDSQSFQFHAGLSVGPALCFQVDRASGSNNLMVGGSFSAAIVGGSSFVGNVISREPCCPQIWITSESSSGGATLNGSHTFSVTAVNGDSTPLMYQWKRNGVDIPGANGPTYTVNPITVTGMYPNALFAVEVKNGCRCKMSQVVVLADPAVVANTGNGCANCGGGIPIRSLSSAVVGTYATLAVSAAYPSAIGYILMSLPGATPLFDPCSCPSYLIFPRRPTTCLL
jgi:hypothetical protein